MKPRIEILAKKRLIGISQKMSFDSTKIVLLWKSFMSGKKKITNTLTTDLFAVQIYEDGSFNIDSPPTEFTMWAAVEVADFSDVPDGMESLALQNGLYAVFLLKGSDAESLYDYILKIWLPKSDFLLDNRPHFQLMGSKYKNNDPSSEEDFWIPIKRKNHEK